MNRKNENQRGPELMEMVAALDGAKGYVEGPTLQVVLYVGIRNIAEYAEQGIRANNVAESEAPAGRTIVTRSRQRIPYAQISYASFCHATRLDLDAVLDGIREAVSYGLLAEGDGDHQYRLAWDRLLTRQLYARHGM